MKKKIIHTRLIGYDTDRINDQKSAIDSPKKTSICSTFHLNHVAINEFDLTIIFISYIKFIFTVIYSRSD
jgi:hypothetical protein